MLFIIPVLVVAVTAPLDMLQGRRRARSAQRRGQRPAACLVLAFAAMALLGSCAMLWWEASDSAPETPGRTDSRLGDPLVTLIIVGVAVVGLVRLAIVLRNLRWGAATIHAAVWPLFIVGIAVANPQLFTDDAAGDLQPGYYVGIVASGLVTLAGLIDWPMPARAGPTDRCAGPGGYVGEWPPPPPRR